jgi:hypothetical protein
LELAVLVFFMKQQNDGETSPMRFRLDCLNRPAEEGVVDLRYDESDCSS